MQKPKFVRERERERERGLTPQSFLQNFTLSNHDSTKPMFIYVMNLSILQSVPF
jgi:hypothetical protein